MTTAAAALASEHASRSGDHAPSTIPADAGALRCAIAPQASGAGCSTPPLGIQSLLADSSIGYASAAASLAATRNGGPGGTGRGGSVTVSPPVSPTPGPAPSGASGGAAMGGSGLAPTAFLTLAGLLLLAAPHALRRLRLSSEPWLTAFFVLIPERPG